MTNSNRIKLTWISFFSYALTGALVIVTGMVMGNIADYFHLPVSSMSNTFTFLNAGYPDLYLPERLADGNCAAENPAAFWLHSDGTGRCRADV
ncbi:putative transporter [Raoultella planticola]|uniref:Putative transporter n=1 Tax=Raoultella planticola TaxID=575 RepID=A0A485CLY9_RAOPL|nr:putative transporter [Raoultella planticola]